MDHAPQSHHRRAPSTHAAPADADVGVVARLVGATVQFDGTLALAGVDVEIPSGVVGLLGPNGAGKSTLFRVLLGLQRLEAGEVEVLGWPSPEASRRIRAEVGYMPEDDSLFPELKAVEQVVHAARLSGLSRVDAVVAAHRALDRVELGDHRYRPGALLSLGGRQRLRLAMALVHGPRLLLLDEPTAGLDPEARSEMLALIAEVGGTGTAVVLSTHVLGDVEAICRDVVVMSRGRVAFVGPVERFRSRPDQSGGVLVEVEGDVASLCSRLQAHGVEAVVDGLGVRVIGEPPLPEAFWRAAGEANVGIRSAQPAREAMSDAFVRHLRLDDPDRRVGDPR
jgi:ABC-2 type transport system ATP-binding protein